MFTLCLDAYRESRAHSLIIYSFLGVISPRLLELSKNFDFRDFPISRSGKKLRKELEAKICFLSVIEMWNVFRELRTQTELNDPDRLKRSQK